MPESTVTKTAQPEASHKEFVESILVAFILAFIFRAFVVEAFVIPTGSMAPTLYGAHMRYRCPDCGFTFDVGYKAKSRPDSTDDDLEIPTSATTTSSYHCPNCGYEIPPGSEPVRFGDRILVLKYLYLFQKPQPWDVVVFKSPSEDPAKHMENDPEYSMNYIKRLIAVGPASVAILDGDVYLGPADAEGPQSFAIQRKPKHVQDALWRVIYDNDFIPHMGAASTQSRQWTQPWQEESHSGWTLSGPASTNWPGGAPARIFDFTNLQGGGAISFRAKANEDTHALTDWLVYDEADRARPTPVSDLKLSCDYTRRAGQGPLRLQLSKKLDIFTAELTPGKVSLYRSHRPRPDQTEKPREDLLKTENLPPELSGSAPLRVELSNVDYRVSVRVNGKEVIQTTDEQYYPKVKDLWEEEEVLPGRSDDRDDASTKRLEVARQKMADEAFANEPIVRIEAQQQDARIEHLVLSRDIYYISLPSNGSTFWATVQKISHLKAGEYFVMGDNSLISGDARYWSAPVILPHEGLSNLEPGRVPEQFMLGKAFFVYWPAGYRFPFISVNAVPDFGEMRFIR